MQNNLLNTYIIPASIIKDYLTVDNVLKIMKETYANTFLGTDINPIKYSLVLPGNESEYHFINSMPSYLGSQNIAGIKWVSVFSNNGKSSIPTVLGTIILNNADNGVPVAILDGTYITNLRTGFSGVIPAQYCANPNSESMTIIGPGVNAGYVLNGITQLFDIKKVYIIGKTLDSANLFCNNGKATYKNIEFIPLIDINEESNNADIIFITTNSKTKIINMNKPKNGAYVCSLTTLCDTGADILKYVDSIIMDQPSAAIKRIKELSGCDISQSKCATYDIGEIIANNTTMYNPNKVTLSIPVGLSVVDVALANFTYQQIKHQNMNNTIKLYDI